MKPTSPLSLLLFLRLASAAPLPLTIDALYPTDCHSKSCIISLLTTPHTNHHTPPTHLTSPHFPSHQLSESPLSAPSSDDRPTPALTSSQPLSSSFLLSLTNPASHPSIQKAPVDHDRSAESTENLPAKPSSALAELRAADLRKYWETLRPASAQNAASPNNAQMERCEMGMSGEMFGGRSERFYYMHRARMGTSGRDYADLMVVGIVVLFLAVVVALEAVERCSDLGGILCGRRQRRGEIYLEDDNLFIVKKPFELSPAPASRDKRDSMDYRDEKEAFAYDSDAAERV